MFFYNMVVPKLKKRKILIEKVHGKFGYFVKTRTLVKIKKQFFWCDKT
jgi:hypothetical protein